MQVRVYILIPRGMKNHKNMFLKVAGSCIINSEINRKLSVCLNAIELEVKKDGLNL